MARAPARAEWWGSSGSSSGRPRPKNRKGTRWFEEEAPDLDLAGVPPYRVDMSEELSKRIDDLHKRFDDLRADMNQRFADLSARISDTNKRIDDLRVDMNQRFNDMNQKLTTFMWIVSAWFTFLTAVLAVFGFLRR